MSPEWARVDVRGEIATDLGSDTLFKQDGRRLSLASLKDRINKSYTPDS